MPKPEKVATSIQACATGGLTTCCTFAAGAAFCAGDAAAVAGLGACPAGFFAACAASDAAPDTATTATSTPTHDEREPRENILAS